MRFFYSLISFLVFFVGAAHAQILGPSVTEVTYSYSASFVSDNSTSPEELAQNHASHMFGIFHSPKMINRFGLDELQVGGIGSPRSDNKIRVLKSNTLSDGRIQVFYTNSGKMILHKQVAAELLKAQQVVLPLPADLNKIYDVKCTDSHYTTEGDYWYFYDPFRKGCEYLSKSPYATDTLVKIFPSTTRKLEQSPRLDLLRGDNGNGDEFSISVIHGFAESAKDKEDDGRGNWLAFRDYALANGFKETNLKSNWATSLKQYDKAITLASGKTIKVKIQSLLVETGISSRSTIFAKFLKDAVFNSDVIVYAGHSGLGGNLDIPSLEGKAGGEFVFNKKKRQIFYFDSCASYAYYMHMFASEKTRAKIDVLTNGLSSYFHTGPQILANFMNVLLNPKIKDATWLDILSKMEEPLDGGSYLLSVGGV